MIGRKYIQLVLCLGFVWSYSTSIQAQNISVIDSLKSELVNADEQTQFKVLSAIGFEYRFSYPDSTIFYCTQAYELGKRIDVNKLLSMPVSFIGLAYTNKGDYLKSFENHQLAIKIAMDQNDSVQLGHGYNNLGRLFLYGGDLVRAESNFSQSLRIFEKLNNKSGLAYVYRSMASVYREKEDYDRAIEMSEKALFLRTELGDERSAISSLIDLGLLLKSKGESKQAIEKFNQADLLAKKLNDKVTIAELATATAEIQLEDGKLEEAFNNANQVLKIISESSYEILFIRAMLVKAKVLKLKNKCGEAVLLIDKVLEESRSSGNLNYESESLFLGAECYSKLGRVDRANHYQKDLDLLNEKLRNTDLLHEVDQLQFQLMTEKMEAENKVLRTTQSDNEAEIEKQRFQNILLIIIILSFLIITSILVWFNKKNRAINLKLLKQNEKILQQQTAISETNAKLVSKNQQLSDLNNEKDSFMNIVAHDLKAPLQRIQGLLNLLKMEGDLTAQQNEYLQMVTSVTKSSSDLITDLLDVSYLNQPDRQLPFTKVNINQLIKNRIESFRVAAAMKEIEINYFPGIPEDEEFITVANYLTRILDNLLSNALKFTVPATEIRVITGRESDHYIISVVDQGPGFTEEDKKQLFQKFKRLSAQPTGGEGSNGLGLAIVKTLVDYLQGEIILNSEVGMGSEFKIMIPTKKV